MLLLVVLAVIGAGVFALSQYQKVQKERLAQERLEQGLSAYEEGDYEAALDPLSTAVSDDKENVDLLVKFAETRSRVPELNDKHIREAIGLYNQAIRLDPAHVPALTKLLRLLEMAGAWGTVEAFDAAHLLLKAEPENPLGHEALATYHFTHREFIQTLEQVRKMQQYEPEDTDWYLRELHTHFARIDSADPTLNPDEDVSTYQDVLALCDQWIEQDEQDGRFEFVKAYAQTVMGRADDARETALAAVTRGVSSPKVHQDLVMLLEQLGADYAADELIANAKEAFPDEPWVWEQAIRRPWLKRDIGAAMAELAAAKAQFPVLDSSILKWQVLLEILDGRDAAARQSLNELEARLDDVSDDAERTQLQAWVKAMEAHLALGQANFAEARRTFKEATELVRDDPVIWYITADAYHSVAEFDLASDAYGMAWRLEPSWISAAVAYGNTLLQLGRPQDAIAVCIEMEGQKEVVSPPIFLLYVRAWIDTAEAYGSVDEAGRFTGRTLFYMTSTLEQIRQSNSIRNVPVIADLLFRLYELEGNTGGAQSIVDEVLAMENEAPAELLLIAARGSRIAELGAEEELMRRALEKDGPTYDVVQVQAWLRLEAGDASGGLEAIEQARAAAEGSVGYNAEEWDTMRALYLVRAEDPRATDALGDLLKKYPDSIEIPGMILAQRLSWRDEELIDRAVAAQERILGADLSTRLRLAKATRTMQFNSDDPEAVAEALRLVAAALTDSPSSLAGLTLMADALMAGEPPRPREAIEYYEKALQEYPSRVDLYPKIIYLCQEIGEHDKAMEWLSRLAARDDRSQDIRRTQLMLLERSNALENAIELVRTEGDMSDIEDRLSLASLYLRTHEYEQADEQIEGALEIDAENELAIRLKAELLAATNRAAQGVELLQTAPVAGGPGAREARLGAFYRRTGDYPKAIESLVAATRAESDNPRYWEDLSLAYLSAGRLDDALSAAERGLNLQPQDDGLLANYAMASLDADADTRRKALERLREDGDAHAPLVALLEAYQSIDGEDPSPSDLTTVRRLTERFPEFLPAWRLAVNLHLTAGNREAAYDLATRASTRLAAEPTPARWSANIAAELDRLPQALRHAQAWRARSYQDVLDPDVFIAMLHMRNDDPMGAAQVIRPHYDRVLADAANDQLDAEVREIALGRAFTATHMLLSDGQFDYVAQRITPLLRTDEQWRSAWIELTGAIDDQAVAEAMLNTFENTLRESPEQMMLVAGAWNRYAQRSRSDAHLERAAAAAQRAVDADPALRLRANLLLATVEGVRGNAEEAERLYRVVLAEDPRNVAALNNLAYLIASDDARLTQAANLSRQAVEQQPEFAPFLDTYAFILNRQGNFSEAEPYARKAVSLQKTSPEMRLTLAEVLYAANKYDEALAELKTAEDLLANAAIPNFDESLPARAANLRTRIEEARSLSSAN